MDLKKGIFITGTSTEIGKTIVSSLLVSSLRSQGIPAGYFKPVQAGIPTDFSTVASYLKLLPQEQANSTYAFSQPLAPIRAASLSGVKIDLRTIVKQWKSLAARSWVVEGAGGLLVPLNSTETIRELIRALDLSVIIVSSTRLGTMNHTLLTLESAQNVGIHVAGLVMVGAEDPGLIEALQIFTSVPILAQIPWLPELTGPILKSIGERYFPTEVTNEIFCRNY